MGKEKLKGSLDNNTTEVHKGLNLPFKRLENYHSTYTYGTLEKRPQTTLEKQEMLEKVLFQEEHKEETQNDKETD